MSCMFLSTQVCQDHYKKLGYTQINITDELVDVYGNWDQHNIIYFFECKEHNLLKIARVALLVLVTICTFGLSFCSKNFKEYWIHSLNKFKVLQGRVYNGQVCKNIDSENREKFEALMKDLHQEIFADDPEHLQKAFAGNQSSVINMAVNITGITGVFPGYKLLSNYALKSFVHHSLLAFARHSLLTFALLHINYPPMRNKAIKLLLEKGANPSFKPHQTAKSPKEIAEELHDEGLIALFNSFKQQ